MKAPLSIAMNEHLSMYKRNLILRIVDTLSHPVPGSSGSSGLHLTHQPEAKDLIDNATPPTVTPYGVQTNIQSL